MEPPVAELPEGLDIISEIESAIFEVRPAGVGRPSANREEAYGEAENRSFAGVGRELRRCGHRSCLSPSGGGIQAYQAGLGLITSAHMSLGDDGPGDPQCAF